MSNVKVYPDQLNDMGNKQSLPSSHIQTYVANSIFAKAKIDANERQKSHKDQSQRAHHFNSRTFMFIYSL